MMAEISSERLYMLCGLATRSNIRLTRVAAFDAAGAVADVTIRRIFEPLGQISDGPAIEHTPSRSTIRIRNVGEYEVAEGRSIAVRALGGIAAKDVEIFLLGPAWATLCHQRGILPLHASAVATSRGIIAFAGASGAGKSTIAARMGGLGYDLVSDDVVPVTTQVGTTPGAWPYLRRLKLNRDMIDRYALVAGEPVGADLDTQKSFVMPPSSASDRWRPLEAIYVLDPERSDGRLRAKRLIGAEAIGALANNTYHYEYVRLTGRYGEHLRKCAEIASTVPVYRLTGLRGAGSKHVERLLLPAEEAVV